MSHIFNPDPEREKNIREALSNQLGVEFFSPDDPEMNQRVDVQEVTSEPDFEAGAESRRRPHSDLRPVSVGDIIRMAQQLGAHSGAGSETRRVLYLCCTALQQLVDRLELSEASVRKYQTAVIAAMDGNLEPGAMTSEVEDDTDDGDGSDE